MSKKYSKKGNGPKFVMLPYWLMETPGYTALSSGARVLFNELIKRFTGMNNGSIYLPSREAAKRMNKRRDAIMRYFRELETAGFIVATSQHSLGLDGKGRSAKWRLTHLSTSGAPATNDFKKTKALPDNRATSARKSGQEVEEVTTNSPKVARKSGQGNDHALHDNRANITSSHRQSSKPNRGRAHTSTAPVLPKPQHNSGPNSNQDNCEQYSAAGKPAGSA